MLRSGILYIAGLLFLGSNVSAEESFPSKPIKLIVPYAAGGITDQVARQVAEKAGLILGQSIIVENKPGANGTMGATQIKNSLADGYTLTMAPVGLFRQPYMEKTNYDPIRDFTYISMLAGYSSAIGVHQSSPYKTLKDLIDAAKENNSNIAYGTSGTYSTHHLAMVTLGHKVNAQWTHIPFKGDSEAVTTLLGKNIDAIVVANTMRPHVEKGTIRILTTFGNNRSADYPEAPTAMEQGFDVVMSSPFGIIAPKGVPEYIVNKLEKSFQIALDDKGFKNFANQVGLNIMYMNAAEYKKYAVNAVKYEKDLLISAGLDLRK